MRMSDGDQGGTTGGVVTPALVAGVNTLAAGQANGAALTAALAAGGDVQISTPGTYYLARPTTNYDAAIQCDNLTGVSLILTNKGVIFKLADGANCYMEHWWQCTDCRSLGGIWDGNVAANGGTVPAVWWAGWHTDLRWVDGCTRFTWDNTRAQADPTYQGVNAIIHGFWVTGNSRAKLPTRGITMLDIDLNMQRDGIHFCGGVEDYSLDRIKGFHGDNGLGLGTCDYPAHQVAIGSHKRGYIGDIQFEGGLQAPVSFFGRNENEQVAGSLPTRIKNENCTVNGLRGAVQSVVVTSVVKGNPTTINTATAYLWRNGVSTSFSGMAGTGWTAMNNQSLAITQVTPTQFTVPFDSSALVSANYTANSGRTSSCASGIQIADDSAGGAGQTYTGFTITTLTLSGDSLTATVTPNIMSSGAGATFAPVLQGSLMIVDSAGTNEAIQVQSVAYTGLLVAPLSFTCIKTDGTAFSAAAGTYAGKTLTGTSPGVLTALYVDSMLWEDIAPIVPPNQPVVSLTGTGIQTLKISKPHVGSKNANFGGILCTSTAVGNLIVDTLTTDQGFLGTGLVFGALCNVRRWSLANSILDGTGGAATNIGVTVGGTLGNGVVHNCHNILGSQLINCPTTASYLAAPTFIEVSNCTYNGTAGNSFLVSWGAGAGAASEMLLSNCYALSGGGTTIQLTGANALILTFRMTNCHTSTNTVGKGSSQLCRPVGDASIKMDYAFTTSPSVGDCFYNNNAASAAGLGLMSYTTGWVYPNGVSTTVADAGTIGNFGNQTVVWNTGTAAQTENLPASPFANQRITFQNGHATVPTTLSGNGHNIVSGAVSAATKAVAALTSLELVYDLTNTLWRSIS